MNILHISSHDLLGASFNGYYMLDQKDPSYKFNMLVWFKDSANPKVFTLIPQNRFFRRCLELFNSLMVRIGTDHISGLITYRLLSKQACFKNADIIHLHLIHNFPNFGICQLPKLCKEKTIVWTIHDQWACTGGCIHPINCDGAQKGCPKKCIAPRKNSSLLSKVMPYFTWKIKERAYSKFKAHLVVSDKWMSEILLSSLLLKKIPHSIIPFGLDTSKFCNRGKQSSRLKLGISEEDFVISFRNLPIETDLYKGIKYIKDGLETFIKSHHNKVTILMIQNLNGFESIEKSCNVVKLGVLNSDQLVDVYSASDVYLMPSLYESFGMMALESMACETPVIAATGTPLQYIVGDMECGLVVERKSGQAIADAIEKLINNPGLAHLLGHNGRKKVLEHYSLEKCIRLHKQLYKSLIADG